MAIGVFMLYDKETHGYLMEHPLHPILPILLRFRQWGCMT